MKIVKRTSLILLITVGLAVIMYSRSNAQVHQGCDDAERDSGFRANRTGLPARRI